MDTLTNKIVSFIVEQLKKTPLGKSLDISQYKAKIAEIFADVTLKLDKANLGNVVSFIEDSNLFQQCIMPNIVKICADDKLDIQDTPHFIDIIYGVYSSVSVFIQDNPTINMTSNDIIELVGLLLKITLVMTVPNPANADIGVVIVSNVIKLVKMTIKTKKMSCKLCCCCRK